MKTLFLFVAALFLAQLVYAQWEPDVRLTDDPSSSLLCTDPGIHSIVASGDSIHVVWSDNRDGNYEIYYKRSVDGGLTWGDDIRLTSHDGDSKYPSIAVSGSIVHVAWSDYRISNSNTEIYYKRSADGGNTWGEDIRLTNTPIWTWQPCIIVSGSFVHMVYYEYSGGQWDIYCQRSTDSGLTWGPMIKLNNGSTTSLFPSICSSDSVLHVAWQDKRIAGNSEIFYKRSTNAGVDWGADTRLSYGDTASVGPCIVVAGSAVYVAWSDFRDGNYEVYFKCSADGGLTWGPDTRLTNNSGRSFLSNLAVSGSRLFLVWYDDSDGNLEIYYKNSIDGGLNWGPDERLTDEPAESNYAFIAVSGTLVHVVWNDNRDGNNEIYYKRNSTGNSNVGLDKKLVNKPGNSFRISPNPASDKIHINFNTCANKETLLVIRNMLGEELVCKRIQNIEEDIDVSGLPNGIYCTSILSGNMILSQEKLVISK